MKQHSILALDRLSTAATVLLSAWLLFQIQPMAAKRILPWFGGGAAVWTTAMLFFQMLLLAGYAYAHVIHRYLHPRKATLLHVALLIAAIAMIGLFGPVARENWKPANSDHPQLRIMTVLAVSVALPYLLLSATAPLIQARVMRADKTRPVYRLYALSNAGSLAALISYPLIVEPLIGLHAQAAIWTATFLVFVATCAFTLLRASSKEAPVVPAIGAPIAVRDRWLWLAMPACASVLLLAVTNYLCQDVAPVPMLWIAPLVIYLLTFILTFESDRWYRRLPWMIALAVCSFAACASWLPMAKVPFAWQVAIHLGLLMSAGMVCHGEVARRRPSSGQLTSFYLLIATGGAMGGVLVAIVAPRAFADFYELPLGILAAWALSVFVLASDRTSPLYRGRNLPIWMCIVIVTSVLAMLAWAQFGAERSRSFAIARNFFGVIKVADAELRPASLNVRRLAHGRIVHGMQFLDADRHRDATQYYAPQTGIGQLLTSLPIDAPNRIGVVGLGAGTLAAYPNAGDAITFYEIDPNVISFADRYFTFLDDARRRGVNVQIVESDARLALEREVPQHFDLLVLDAFSGDAIPVHLLTAEAFALYLRHVGDGSVIAVHITNRNVDLTNVVRAAAMRFNLSLRVVSNAADESAAVAASDWILLQRSDAGQPTESASTHRPLIWTDDHSSLLPMLKWK